MRDTLRIATLVAAGAALWMAGAGPAAAQTVVGQILDEANGRPVAGALVSLLDAGDEVRARAIADSLGRFSITPDEPGSYRIGALRIGYEPGRTPLLDLTFEGRSPPLEILIAPAPVGLEGFEVTAERSVEEFTEWLGVSAGELGNRLITRDEIEKRQSAPDVMAVLEWQNVPGIRIVRPENGGNFLCVSMNRGRTASGFNRCAIFILDGQVTPMDQMVHLSPQDVEAMVLLTPTEATQVYGTPAGGGALVIYTMRGGR